MSVGSLPMREALRFGWKTTIANIGFWIGLFLLIFFCAVVLQVMEHFAKDVSLLLYVNLALLGAAFQTIVNAGLVAVSLKFCDSGRASLQDFLVAPLMIAKFFLAYLLYGLIVLLGLLLLIVPGIIWAIKYFPMVYLVLDQDMSPGDAFRKSAELTDGVKSEIAVFLSLQFLINFAGFLLLFIGLFVTVPLCMLATAYIYRHLASRVPEQIAPAQPGLSPHVQT